VAWTLRHACCQQVGRRTAREQPFWEGCEDLQVAGIRDDHKPDVGIVLHDAANKLANASRSQMLCVVVCASALAAYDST